MNKKRENGEVKKGKLYQAFPQNFYLILTFGIVDCKRNKIMKRIEKLKSNSFFSLCSQCSLWLEIIYSS